MNNKQTNKHLAQNSDGQLLDVFILQIVTCSGAHKSGSLRVVRGGVSVVEEATIEMVGVTALFALSRWFFPYFLVLMFFLFCFVF